ncbi:outer membrane beta-barrel protein [Colwellia sp. MSW7]|jgi:outer membrane protein|uniref:Outer membrane beta-barrel protein n=1 Tax=Colwellia maritima TaxID=2912588 RepID=A0ABS9WXS8_9GAMM|nr:OmpW family outer membrane protein [Colwellia maritima]MCI2282297.1 outer membrane beta-barrel protein [Colwellia maritima]
MKKSLLTIALLSSLSTAVLAHQAGDILVRGGATSVNPDSENAAVLLSGADSTMSLSVDDNTQLGLNLVYFYDSNWAVELLAATPFTHDVTIYDPNAVLGVDGAKLAEVTHLPPTLSALYYIDMNSAFKPYVGVGINYTHFFNEEFEAAPKSLGLTNLKLDGSFGFAVQLGADYEIDENWSVNFSARYIDISTDATFDVAGDNIGKAKVDVDPMVYSLMVGYKF